MDMDLHGSSKKQDWGTPTDWFNRLHGVFNFTVDACAQPHNAKLPRYWTPEQDGLKQDWFGERVWCNPPYGRELKQWAEKFKNEIGFVNLAVMLTPSRTDTRWFSMLCSNYTTFCFLRGRLKFEPVGDAAPFPSLLTVVGDITPAQTEYLKSIGLLMKEI